MNRHFYSKEYLEFKVFWDNEIMDKLLRCSKELGFYNKLKKVLSDGISRFNENHFHDIYLAVKTRLLDNEMSIVLFKKLGYDVKRAYSTHYAVTNKRHLAQMMVLVILKQCHMDSIRKEDAFKMMDKMIFEKHKVSSYVGEKLSFLRLIFY